MTTVRQPAVANAFYSGDAIKLKKQISLFLSNSKNTNYKSRAVIVPHAGHIYSGQLACECINQLDKSVKNIFIFAPAHRVWFDGIAISSFDEWKTPIGNIKINKELTKKLINNYGANYNDNAHSLEHSIEVQIPFIQCVFNEVNIIPILIANQSPDLITNIIQDYWQNKENAFIISSDLSHYLNDKNAKKLDNITAQMIEEVNFNDISHEQACGLTGIIGLANFTKNNNFSLIRLNMTNSGAMTEDKSSVVGYGTWFLYEGERNKYIKEYYSTFIKELVIETIKSQLNNEKQKKIEYPQVLNEVGACFITLEKNGNLRGCIGSVSAYRPLIEDIIEHSKDSAFEDTRFTPVSLDEIEDLSVSISLLSVPDKIEFEDEQDLLNKIVPNVDGLIIRDGDYGAVYLPSVWEQLPDKQEFLISLKLKAGMKANHFSKTFRAFRFKTVCIE